MTSDDRGHVGELLDAWRTGELEPAEGERVATHLAECDRCREELAALGPLVATFERGFAAGRRRAEDLAPDWAAQRAAIVARTSGRPPAAGRRRAFLRWAPQLAAAAVAAIVIGVVWREAGPGPGSAPEPMGVEAPVAAGPEDEPVSSRDELATRADGDAVEATAGAARERPATPGVPGEEDRLGEAKARARLEAAAGAREQEAAPAEQYRAGNEAAALEDRVEPAAADAASADLGRFQRQARAALADRDTMAARRALALWGDTLAPRLEADAPAAALADSLRALIEAAE